MTNLKELQELAKHFSILYVEDNESLRKNATKLFKKFFSHVDVAEDGEKGLSLFKENRYPIVVSDIKMPHMDGMELTNHIHKIKPQTKVIIMSAFDDKELLLEGIKLGVFRFLKKPVNVSELSSVLTEAILEIKHEQHESLFQMHLKNIFEYQSSMVVLLIEGSVVLANDIFLDFFGYESVLECKQSLLLLGDKFLEHNGFLYESDGVNPLERVKNNPDKLFNVKMKDIKGKIRHFIIKYKAIPQKKDYGILSFDDISELNLLGLFDAKKSEEDEVSANTEVIYEFLNIIQRNDAKIELHNYYKGLSITNDGVIDSTENNRLCVKTTYMQQKAVQIEQKTLIISDALPHAIEASEIEKMSFDLQSITFKKLKFITTSPIKRKTIRVVPGEKQITSLFIGEGKYHGDIEIEDISLDAVKLKLATLPPGLEKDSEVVIDIVLEVDKKPLIINTKALFYRKQETKRSFSLVFMFKDLKTSELVKYITKRQMELIREIKRM